MTYAILTSNTITATACNLPAGFVEALQPAMPET
jgi:hypothetical protein